MYPTLPTPPHAELGEGTQHYGVRLLMFVVETQVTATMSESELELAAYVVPVAMWGKGKDGTDLLVVEAIRAAAALVSAALLRLRKLTAEEETAREAKAAQAVEGGQKSPLLPSPKGQPPPAHARQADDWEEYQRRAEADPQWKKYIEGRTKGEWEIPMSKPGDKIRF